MTDIPNKIFHIIRSSPVLKGSMWFSISLGSERIIRLLRNMILARILAPEIFGELAIIISINALFETLTNVGIKSLIIQNPQSEEESFLNGVWWFSLVRAASIYMVGFVAAPYLADFFGNDEMTLLFRIAFLAILFNGMISSRAYLALKKMDFKTWCVIYYGGGAIGTILTIILSFIFANMWALIIGFVFESFARLGLSFIICPFLPRLKFNKSHTKSMFKYATGMLGMPVFVFIFMRADIFVIGKVMSNAELGIYTMAITLARMPLSILSEIMGKIILPLLSKVQHNNTKLNIIIMQATSMIVALSFPMLAFLMVNGKFILSITYGQEYILAISAVIIFFTGELLRVSGVPIVSAYFSKGRPELNRTLVIVRAIIIVLIIYPMVKYFGLIGAASSTVIAVLLALSFQVKAINNLTCLDIKSYLLVLFKGVALFIAGYILNSLFNTVISNNLANAVLGIIVYCASLITAYFIFPEINSILNKLLARDGCR